MSTTMANTVALAVKSAKVAAHQTVNASNVSLILSKMIRVSAFVHLDGFWRKAPAGKQTANADLVSTTTGLISVFPAVKTA